MSTVHRIAEINRRWTIAAQAVHRAWTAACKHDDVLGAAFVVFSKANPHTAKVDLATRLCHQYHNEYSRLVGQTCTPQPLRQPRR